MESLVLRTGTNVDAQEMKEEYIADNGKSAASSTLSQAKRTIIVKLVEEIASLCSIYDIDLRNLASERIGVKSWTFFLAEQQYGVRRDQNDIHIQYDVFGSDEMRDMAKSLGTSRSSWGVSTSLLPFYKLYSGIELLVRKKRKSETVKRMFWVTVGIESWRAEA